MTDAGGTATVLVVDMANVVGSVPEGWWRDRVGAAERLLSGVADLVGRTVIGPEGSVVRIPRIVAVLEGRANAAIAAPGHATHAVEIVRAAGSGDDVIAALASELIADGDQVLVVSADRGLRSRLPPSAADTGPGWLNDLLGRGSTRPAPSG